MTLINDINDHTLSILDGELRKFYLDRNYNTIIS